MLILSHATRYFRASNYRLLTWCIRNCASAAACPVFEEIPNRGELPLSDTDPYPGPSSVSVWDHKFHYQGYHDVVLDGKSRDRASVYEALQLFCRATSSGAKPTKFVLCSALNSCAKTQNWHLGLQIHAQNVKFGFEDNIYLNSSLVDLYAKCYAVVDAKKVFSAMRTHDLVSWTSIISALSQNGCTREAILMFKDMLSTPMKPNCFTYVSVVSSCTGLKEELQLGSLLHAHVIHLGFNSNTFVVSSIIDYYSKSGRINEAKLLFHEATERDSILFNSMISGYSQNLYGEEALKLFMNMRYNGLSPTDHTISSILNACGSLTLLEQGKQVHSLVTKSGSECNVFVVSALVDMYSKCGSVEDARSIFDQTVQKNSVLWTSMITGYAQNGKGLNALELFDIFVAKEGFLPDHICFTAVLTACNHSGFLDRGIKYFTRMEQDYGLHPEVDQYACLVDLYARNGQLGKARELMEQMPYEPNYVMWSSFLSSCKVHGEVELGQEAAYWLIEMEPYNAAHYVTLAHIFAKAGLWGEVAEVRNLMQQKGVRKSAGWSWIEIDKKAHVFSVGDATHPQSQEIYSELEQLNLDMKEAGNAPRKLE